MKTPRSVERALEAGSREIDDLVRLTAEIESRIHKARWRAGPQGYGLYWVCAPAHIKGHIGTPMTFMTYRWADATCSDCLAQRRP